MKMYNELITKKRGTGGNHPRLFFLDYFKVKKIIIR